MCKIYNNIVPQKTVFVNVFKEEFYMKKFVSLLTVLAIAVTMLFSVSVSADGSSERIDLSGTQTLYESATGEWSSGKIVAKDENGNEITKGLSYSSNYDFVLTVSADGTVTPKHEGCAIVTVTKENPDKTTVSAKIALNVTKGAKHNNRFESGNDLKLNFSRSGNHCKKDLQILLHCARIAIDIEKRRSGCRIPELPHKRERDGVSRLGMVFRLSPGSCPLKITVGWAA